jgi:hypothetical protein
MLYSALYYSLEKKIKLEIVENSSIARNGAILIYENKNVFFDYSDDTIFIDDPNKYDFYFKRSLLPQDYTNNIYPLNFLAIISYKTIQLFQHFKTSFLLKKVNRVEFARAIDLFDKFTNASHNCIDVRKFPTTINDNNGSIIFSTRLWSPDKKIDAAEKERRRLQNDFRINACRIIKKSFPNSITGIFPDAFAISQAKDILIDSRMAKKKNYLNLLRRSDICIADDGLKDTPGWKIGEYTFFSKAIITTPIRVVIENFQENTNYLSTQHRSNYQALPDLISELQRNKRYLEMAEANRNWNNEYVHPKNYFHRILKIILH